MEIGAMMTFLPKPPARLLDLGCGTGWTSIFFAKAGYDVVGVDICEDMILEARKKKESEGVKNLKFIVSDYEHMNFNQEFDGAIFFDSLHHSVNEEEAIFYVQRALKPNGICVASEPGVGHEATQGAKNAVEKYGVTERDMPPKKIIAAGKKAGFRKFLVYPHTDIVRAFYNPFSPYYMHRSLRISIKKILYFLAPNVLHVLHILFINKYKSTSGITVLVK